MRESTCNNLRQHAFQALVTILLESGSLDLLQQNMEIVRAALDADEFEKLLDAFWTQFTVYLSAF